MLRAYKYRLYPTAEQAEFFSKSFGCCRVAYNRTLDYMSMMWCGAGVGVNFYGAKTQLVALKEIYPWFGEVNSQSLQYAVICIGNLVLYLHRYLIKEIISICTASMRCVYSY